MTSVRADAPQEDILRVLTEQAQALWGPERTEVIATILAQTARQLVDVSGNLPDKELEPGFYQ